MRAQRLFRHYEGDALILSQSADKTRFGNHRRVGGVMFPPRVHIPLDEITRFVTTPSNAEHRLVPSSLSRFAVRALEIKLSDSSSPLVTVLVDTSHEGAAECNPATCEWQAGICADVCEDVAAFVLTHELNRSRLPDLSLS